VILTFGLLHRNKGIEYMIRALPRIIRHYPNATYVVLGQTHPTVVQDEGESYRHELVDLTRSLGIEDNVRFDSRFAELSELLEYIGAADVLVTPYTSLDQIASGSLAYAIGMGKAVVSTPYWYAKELLANGRGRLVPPKDPDALADQAIALFGDERGTIAMRRQAYSFARGMSWPVVASSYLELFDRLHRERGYTQEVGTWAGISGARGVETESRVISGVGNGAMPKDTHRQL
jgi:glycosyltransferase involved in cell wall biosynthesis